MGQTQSQSTGRTLDARPPTAAREPDVDPQERERIQAEVNLDFSIYFHTLSTSHHFHLISPQACSYSSDHVTYLT